MFYQISWADYTQLVVVVLFLYYAVVFFFYFRKDFVYLLTAKEKMGASPIHVSPRFKAPYPGEKTVVPEGIAFQGGTGCDLQTQGLQDELTAFISAAGNNHFKKKDILDSLPLLMDKYPSVKSSPFQKNIAHLIKEACAQHCSVHLSDEEIEGFWKA